MRRLHAPRASCAVLRQLQPPRSASAAQRQANRDMREPDDIGEDALHRIDAELDWLEMALGPPA